ncbi:MAG: YidC/Oxa1 family insertase periplasmic-domain containing protein, partial [Planctomycetes bacterium]|nr:YidC/Oxa1 family insertase periplasmic-domain containing protein [Planctomycetota bacterium]
MNEDAKQRFGLMLAIGMTVFLLMQYFYPQRAPAPAPERRQAVEPLPPPAPGATAATGSATGGDFDFEPTGDYAVSVRIGDDEKHGHGYEAVFSSTGAGLTSYRLLGFHRQPQNDLPSNRVILLNRMAPGQDSLRLSSLTTGDSRQPTTTVSLDSLRYELIEAPAGAEITPEPGPEVQRGTALVFRAVVDGWEIHKTFRFPGMGDADLADFTIGMEIVWRNLADGGRQLAYTLIGPAGLIADDDSSQFGIINILTARQPSVASASVEIERRPLPDLAKKDRHSDPDNRANLGWIGAKNRFFTAVMTADPAVITATDGAGRRLFPGDPDYIPFPDIVETLRHQPRATTASGNVPLFEETSLRIQGGTIPAGQSHVASYLLYAGPAVDTLMEDADPRLRGLVSYTISYLDFISRLLVRLLTFFDKFLGNYGLAIIAVTIIIKILLHPLNRKTFVSMNRMSKLAPVMKEMQKKYGSDKVRLQQE